MIKQCVMCKEILDVSSFRVRKTSYTDNYIVAKCRKCELEYNKEHRDIEKRRIAERRRYSTQKAKDKKNSYQRKWRANNILKNRQYHKRSIKKNVDELTDQYISRILIRNKTHIPQPLIEAKRVQLQLKRMIKKLKNGKQ